MSKQGRNINPLNVSDHTVYEAETIEGEPIKGLKGLAPKSQKVFIVPFGDPNNFLPKEVKPETVRKVCDDETVRKVRDEKTVYKVGKVGKRNHIHMVLIDEENGVRESIELDMVPREGDRMFIRRPSEGVTEKVTFYLVLGIIHDATIGEKLHTIQIHVKELAKQ